MGRQFKFRKKRNAPGTQHRQFKFETRGTGGAVPPGIRDLMKRVGEDLLDGRISKEEAEKRISAAFGELSRRTPGRCVACNRPTNDPDDLVCETCAEEGTVETTYTIHIEEEWEDG